MKNTLEKLENKLSILKGKLSHATDPDERAELEECIECVQYDIEEVYDAEYEQASYEEATGTTPQDIYNDRNSHAIAQSEIYDRFRNEY